MYYFSKTLFLVLPLFVLAGTVARFSEIGVPSLVELELQRGGACLMCSPDGSTLNSFCKQDDTCTASVYPNVWVKQTFTNVTQRFCIDREMAGAPGGGKTQCVSDLFQDCTSIYNCTTSMCTNCGLPGTERKTTRCTLSGNDCTYNPGS